MASTATSSPRSGASSPTTRRRWAIAACCNRPRRWPASAAGRNTFKDEFLVALEILHRGDLRPEQLRGSWAGAFGPTQFMPTAFKRYAVDADGDGRRDVVDNPHDLIASTANNLKKDGWQAGATWGYEIVHPQGLQFHAGGPRQGDDAGAMGRSRASSAPAASRIRTRPTRPICWRRPAPTGRAS